jgi:hypothetical protein
MFCRDNSLAANYMVLHRRSDSQFCSLVNRKQAFDLAAVDANLWVAVRQRCASTTREIGTKLALSGYCIRTHGAHPYAASVWDNNLSESPGTARSRGLFLWRN